MINKHKIIIIYLTLSMFLWVTNSFGYSAIRRTESRKIYSNNQKYSYITTGIFFEKINGKYKEKWNISGKKSIDNIDAFAGLITNNGKFVVTYGNEGVTVKYPNDVVIYNGKNGDVIKRFYISELQKKGYNTNMHFFGPTYNIDWYAKSYIDETNEVLHVFKYIKKDLYFDDNKDKTINYREVIQLEEIIIDLNNVNVIKNIILEPQTKILNDHSKKKKSITK